jgi:hypothetical protein
VTRFWFPGHPDWMAAGAAITGIPLMGYLVTRDQLFVPLAFVPLCGLSFLVAVFMLFRWWLSVALTCFLMPVVGFVVIRIDLGFARYRAHHEVEAFVVAGRQAIELSKEACSDPVASVETLRYHCDVRDLLPSAAKYLAPMIFVVVQEARYKVAMFVLRPGFRIVVVYAPEAPTYHCPRIGNGLYLCDDTSRAVGGTE